jgi:ABC-type multidrug transport system fused ATPase/permease subunit
VQWVYAVTPGVRRRSRPEERDRRLPLNSYEATSALDNGSQDVVMQSLARLAATRVVIAHRLSTVQRADRIFVIEHGRIIEAGGYNELIGRDGLFSRLARRQIL